ncbi:sec24-related protein [Anaeramoeba flamelloides]|uniref:Sec24-related protein n=1 Tax=Anaeramoeba flamelloides TaxID=1746091 RepID=A0ABQ8YLN1_9EUKA|nr:sec24-related protein [Anaeramoeba flamelloides]
MNPNNENGNLSTNLSRRYPIPSYEDLSNNVSSQNNSQETQNSNQMKETQYFEAQENDLREISQKFTQYTTTNEKKVPPSSECNFFSVENLNCSPRFMRSSIYCIPKTKALMRTTHLPFGVIVRPLAITHPQEDTIPIVDFGENGPIRCSRCGAYICSNAKFIKGGKIWICPICGVTNKVPKYYFCALNSNNIRHDINERPELLRGTIEFTAKKESKEIKTKAVHYVLVIEVTAITFRQGIFSDITKALDNILDHFPENAYVSIITFNSTIHFYDFNKNEESDPNMIIMSDIHDVFLPISPTTIQPLSSIKGKLKKFFKNLPQMFQNLKSTPSAYGSAMKAASLLIEKNGGKIISFSSQLPNRGMGSLNKRSKIKFSGTDEEKKLFIPQGKYYTNLGKWCLERNIAIDNYFFTSFQNDLSTISELSRITGGEIYLLNTYIPEIDRHKLVNDLIWSLKRPTGIQCVCKLRTSTGICVSKTIGNFERQSEGTEIKLSSINSDQTICYLLEHDMDLKENQPVYLQFAMLYINQNMEKRIRVINLKLDSHFEIKHIFNYIDQETLITLIMKNSLTELKLLPILQIRDNIIQQIINILVCYRRFCIEKTVLHKMVIPSNLQLIPSYALGLTKCKLFRLLPSVSTDEKIFLAHYLRSSTVKLSLSFMYPKMYSLHSLQSGIGLYSKSNQKIMLPSTLKLSVKNLSSKEILLLDNGLEMFLWIGNNVSNIACKLLFDRENIQNQNFSSFKLPILNNIYSKKIHNIIQEISQGRSQFPTLRIIRHSAQNEISFLQFLIEDKLNSISTFEFLNKLHTKIIEKMNY